MLSGLYQVGQAGVAEFTMKDGQVVGEWRLDGACSNAPGTNAVVGNFEGGVFVGSVFLCSKGPGCDADAKYPMLGVWAEDRVTALMKLPPDCRSAALTGKRLILAPASMEQKQRVMGDVRAAEVVRNGNRANRAEAESLLRDVQREITKQDFSAARKLLERSLKYDDSNWGVHAQLGGVLIELGAHRDAREELLIARRQAEAAGVDGQQLADIAFNLGCAYAGMGEPDDAMKELKAAIKAVGYKPYADALRADRQLDPLRNEPEFRRLLEEAKKAKGGKGR